MASNHPESSRRNVRCRSYKLHSSGSEIQRATFTDIRTRRNGEWLPLQNPELLSNQKKTELIDHFSMGSWVSGVLTIRIAGDSLPSHSSLPFIELLCSVQLADVWMVCSELSEHGVYHVHFLLQTTKRSDAVRRLIISNQSRLSVVFDVCKIAGVRYWLGMFCYLLKNPLMVYASDINIASLAYTCIEDGSCIKYNKDSFAAEKPKDVVQVIIQIIQEFSCSSVEDIYLHGSHLLVKYLHLSTLSNIMQNCLQFYKARTSSWDPFSFRFAPEKDPRLIHNILSNQHIDIVSFDEIFWRWITKTNGKKNTIIIEGPSNTGKSLFIRGLLTLLKAGSIVNTSSPFFAEGICGCILGYWEEPLLTFENSEMFKLITEGAPMQIPQKFKKPYNHPGCPIIITTNHDICRFCPNERTTIMNRCESFVFNYTVSSSSGCSAEDCICNSRAQRRSTPCNLNWSASNRDPSWLTAYGPGGNRGSSNSQVYRSCGRWWCNRNEGRLCSSCIGSSSQRTDTRGSDCSSSTTVSGDYRSSGGDSSRSTGNRIHGRDSIQTSRCPEFSGRISPSSGNPDCGSRFRGSVRLGSGRVGADARRSGEPSLECETLDCGWELITNRDSCETEEQTSPERVVCTCIVEPLPADWQAYIAYLASRDDFA